MVEDQIRARSIVNERVLNALRRVPRHCFVPREYADMAYDDRPLPIGHGQTISQPYMVACMTELLAPGPDERILEIGTGSGYQTAILASLGRTVVTVERDPDLLARARACLGRLGYENIQFVCGDGTLGVPAHAPFDAIMVTAGGPAAPRALIEQLADGGRLLCPVGGRGHQRLHRIEKRGNALQTTLHTDCVFVPLTGQDGWPEQTG
ncbi:MAG: protein-L-isoaspartate(D-aspartate) O-methyltransferase [Candidatus Hydrogenedentes bacterium]|nr:protein-L-isoaspartate(D-aspartate) O-methyltransferase [Candidatus Hydrogenedentota bacterium]